MAAGVWRFPLPEANGWMLSPVLRGTFVLLTTQRPDSILPRFPQDRLHTRMPDEKVQPQEIVFPNKNGAKVVWVSRDTPMASLIESLGISPPKNLILLIGGADKLDQKLTSRLTQLFSRGIARAAADAEALIINGGHGRRHADHGAGHCRSRTSEQSVRRRPRGESDLPRAVPQLPAMTARRWTRIIRILCS